MIKDSKLKQVQELYPFKNLPTTVCFEAELKRLAAERDEPMKDVLAKLAKLSGVSERQIYNYRSGATEITPELVRVFCRQFQSLALGMAWLQTFGIKQPETELFDLSRFAAKTVRETLQCGERFLEAFDDGQVDGFEMKELRLVSAVAQRNFQRLEEIAEADYERNQRWKAA